MPIALFVAPQVQGMLKERFGAENFLIVNKLEPATDEDNSSVTAAIVQLDIQPTKHHKGLLPGLHWLKTYLARNNNWNRVKIYITSWNPHLFMAGSAIKLRQKFGAQTGSGLLNSPLISFVSLSELLTFSSLLALEKAYPKPQFKNRQAAERFYEDINQNCYKSDAISLRCHRFRQLLSKFWKEHPQTSGKEVYQSFEREFIELFSDVFHRRYEDFQSSGDYSKAEELMEQLRQTNDFLEYLHLFDEIQLLLVRTERNNGVEESTFSTNILIVTSNESYAAELSNILGNYPGEPDLVFSLEDALDKLKASPNKYSCVFSDFRIYQPNDKLALMQGYEILFEIRSRYRNLQYALLTSLDHARWSQPFAEKYAWVAFRKQDLKKIESKPAYAFQQFLRNAEYIRRNQLIDLGELFDSRKSVFRIYVKDYSYSAVSEFLESRIDNLRKHEQDFMNKQIFTEQWEISKDQPDDYEFVFERFWYRLVLLRLLRCNTKGEILEKEIIEKWYNKILIFIGGDSLTLDSRRRVLTDNLRLMQSIHYHRLSLTELSEKKQIFPHEFTILTKYERS